MSLKLRPIIFIGQLKLFYQHLKTINTWHIPTKAVMTATLSGKVSLGTYAGLKLVVRFFATGTQTEIFKSWNSTDASGNFTITGIPAGIYDVGIKADNSISILKTNQTFTEGTTTNIDFGALLRGDENGDDVGVLVDYSLWLTGNAKTGGCYGYSGNWIVTHP